LYPLCSFIENLFAVKYCTRLKSTKLDPIDDIENSSIFNVGYLYAFHGDLEEAETNDKD
jgi:hypothetical protein